MSVNTGGTEQALIEKLKAEISRQDAVIERLGERVFMVPEGTKMVAVAELEARIQYAIDNRSKSE